MTTMAQVLATATYKAQQNQYYTDLFDMTSVLAYSSGNNIRDGATDATIAIRDAHDSIIDSGKKGSVHLPYGIYLITDTIDWDVSRVSFIGDHAVIIADIDDLSKYVLSTISSETSNPYNQVQTRLEGIQIKCKNDLKNCNGIRFAGGSGNNGASHISFDRMTLRGFNKSLDYQTNAYVINVLNSDICKNAIAINMGSGFSNYGERISFLGCDIFDNIGGIYLNNANGAFHFICCSLDYNYGYQIKIDGGKVFCTDCHIEGDAYAEIPFQVSNNGSTLKISGGWLLNNTPLGETIGQDYMFSNTGTYKGGIYLGNTFVHNLKTDTLELCNGNIVTENLFGYEHDYCHAITSRSNNLLRDGSFEGSSFLDDVFLMSDSDPITSRTQTGTNINLSLSTDYAYAGSKSLKAVKTYGSGSLATFIITAPIKNKNSIPGVLLRYKKPGVTTGTVLIGLGYGKYPLESTGFTYTSFASTSIVFTSAAVDWTQVNIASVRPNIPSWATHIAILVTMNSFNAGDLYIDDVVITEM